MASGNRVKVGLAKQTTFGTAVTTFNIPVKVEDYDYNTEIEQLESAEMFDTVEKQDTLNGNISSTVSMGGRIYPELIGHFLRGTIAAPVTVGASAPYTHTFTGTGTTLPPIYTLGFQYPETTDRSQHYRDARITSLTLAQEAGALPNFSAEFAATARTFLSGLSVTGTPEVTPFRDVNSVGNAFTLSVAGTPVTDYKSVNIQIANPISNYYTLNGTTLPTAQEFDGFRQVTGDFTLRYTTKALSEVDDFEAGNFIAIVAKWQISASVDLTVTIPRFKITSHSTTKAPGVVEVSFSGEGFFDTGISGSVRAVLRNSLATY